MTLLFYFVIISIICIAMKKEKGNKNKSLKSLKNKKREETVSVQNAERYFPDINYGLSDEQVAKRQEDGLINAKPKSLSKSYWSIFRTNFLTLFNALNLFLFILALIFGNLKNSLFMFIIVANIIIGTIQEIRAKKTVEKLSLLSAPKAKVVRNGSEKEISVEEVVLDDIILLKTGNEVISDCILIDGECEVNESLLTGEQDAIPKKEGDILYSGSFLSSGSCRAKVNSVGKENYAQTIVASAQRYKKPNSELMRSINWIIRGISFLLIPVGIIVFLRQYAQTTINNAVTNTIGALISMIPEGLVLLISLALAVGVIKLVKKRTLVQELYCIEALARVDVLCLDKTGTITEGTMQVEKVVPISDGHIISKDDERYNASLENINIIVTNLVRVLNDNNPTFNALSDYFKNENVLNVSNSIAFSSQRKWCAVKFEKEGGYYMGAGEFIFKDRYSLYENDAKVFAEQGYRVLMLAKCSEISENPDISSLIPVAYIVLSDKIRENAKATLDYFNEQGVILKVISGDNPITVSKVAERAGLSGADSFIDATTLDTDEKIFDACDKFTIFGRVSPMQKCKLINALKKKGHTVGMIGDGVNDVMALKESDCSVAIASGSDAARHTSQLVLLDSDFAALPDVVAEGRRVINNIARGSALFLVKTTFSLIVSILLVVLFGNLYPFEPIQVSLVSTGIVGFSSFFLAIEPNNARIKGKFFRRIMTNAVPAGICVALMIFLTYSISSDIGASSYQRSTICLYIYAIVTIIVLFEACRPLNLYRILIIETSLCIFTICLAGFPEFFELASLAPQHIMYLVTVGLCCIPLISLIRLIMSQILNLIELGHKRRQNRKLEDFKNKISEGVKKLGFKGKDEE